MGGIVPITEHIGHINHEMVFPPHVLTVDILPQYHCHSHSPSRRISRYISHRLREDVRILLESLYCHHFPLQSNYFFERYGQ